MLSTDVVAMPSMLADRPYRWLAAAFYWSTRPLLRTFAASDDVSGVTRVITGANYPGPAQGLSMRESLTDAAIMVLG